MTASQRAALITGGTTGIGHATARLLNEQGFRVMATGNNPGTIEEARRTLPEGITVIRADARLVADAELVADEVRKRFGRLDVAFLNAGVGRMLPMASRPVPAEGSSTRSADVMPAAIIAASPSGIGVENCWNASLSSERRVCVGRRPAIFASIGSVAARDPALRRSALAYLRKNSTVAASQTS